MIYKFISALLIFVMFGTLEARPRVKNKYKKTAKVFSKYNHVMLKKTKKSRLTYTPTNTNNPEIEKKRLLAQLRTETDKEKQADIYNQISTLYQNSYVYEDLTKAIFYLKKSVALSKNKWYYYAALANVHSYIKPTNRANVKNYYLKAIESTESNYNKSLYYSYLANIYSAKEYPNYPEAEKYLLKAIEISENDTDKANYYTSLANLYYNTEEKFLDYQSKALELISDLETKSYIYSTLGNFYFNTYREFKQEDFNKGVDYIEKAIETTSNPYNKASYCITLANSMRTKKDLDLNEIVKIYERAISYSTNTYDKAYYHSVIGNVYTEMEPPENAKAITEYEIAIKSSADPITIESYKSIVKILKTRIKKK
jgi:tetratricopeptide (TPR) repeat protein